MEAKSNLLFGVLGLGTSGSATAEFMIRKGYRFIAWDDNEAVVAACQKRFGKLGLMIRKPEDQAWQEVDVLVASPGIPNLVSHRIVLNLKSGARTVCDIELFYEHFPNNKCIAVTGTNGKSTTVKLIEHILNYIGRKARACGNIGVPVLSIIPDKDEILVLEVSSYQLDLMEKFKPDVAVILNITPDHLERHGSFEAYVKSKQKIFQNQTSKDYLVLNIDNSTLSELYSTLKDKKLHPRLVPVSTTQLLLNGKSLVHKAILNPPEDIESEQYIHDGLSQRQISLQENKNLRGRHNAENIICAYAAVMSLIDATPDAVKEAIATYPGLAHRMQFVGELDGVEFVNDSKATNAESAQRALETLSGDIYWIAGGLPKEGGLNLIKDALKGMNHIRGAFLIGEAQYDFAIIMEKCDIPYMISNTLDQAFEDALKVIQEDSAQKKTLLLSPACASFDQWKNFEERGMRFVSLVEKCLSEAGPAKTNS